MDNSLLLTEFMATAAAAIRQRQQLEQLKMVCSEMPQPFDQQLLASLVAQKSALFANLLPQPHAASFNFSLPPLPALATNLNLNLLSEFAQNVEKQPHLDAIAQNGVEKEKKLPNDAGSTSTMPTLTGLLASSAVHDAISANQLQGFNGDTVCDSNKTNESPPAKRARYTTPPKVPSTNLLPSSLISSISAAGSFPLLAAPPPQLPSPVPGRTASTAAAVKSEQEGSPLGRRLSGAFSDKTSTSGSSPAGHGQKQFASLRTPQQRKPAAPIPAEKKDEAYYERRRKNNDAAKRSRDQRRMKEEITAQRAAFLEQENAQLRNQIGLLRTECAKLQAVLLSASNGSTTPALLNMLANSKQQPPLLPLTPVKNSPCSSSSLSSTSSQNCHVLLASPTSTTNTENGVQICAIADQQCAAATIEQNEQI